MDQPLISLRTSTPPSLRTCLQNPNIALALVYRGTDAAAQGVWSYATFTALVYLMTQSTQIVGILQGILGLATVVCAFPAAWAADKTRRDRLLRFHAMAGFLALITITAGLLLPDVDVVLWRMVVGSRMVLLCIAMWLFGCCYAGNPLIEALVADSTPTGMRSLLYSVLYAVSVGSTSLGPALAAVLFMMHGDTWSIDQLLRICLAGLAMECLPYCCLLFFNDAHTLGSESDALTQPLLQPTQPTQQPTQQAIQPTQPIQQPTQPIQQPNDNTTCNPPPQLPNPSPVISPGATWVPWIMLGADIVSGLASGMTIKFFSVWFLKEVKLPPAATNMVMATAPLVMAIMAFLCQRVSKTIGRVQACMVFRTTGVLLLLWMGLQPWIWQEWWIVVVFVLRTAATNCGYPVRRSILMDFVPKSRRAKWSSMQVLFQFGWSGSAVLGGYLVDKYGFQLTFLITGCMQAFATLEFALLLPLVPRFEVPKMMSSETGGGVRGV